MPVTTRSRSLREPKGFKDNKVDTADTRRAATRDCTASTDTIRTRSNTVATIVEDSQTPPESKCQFTPKNSDKENDKRRVGAATTGSSQAARSRSQTASIATSYKGSSIGIGAGNDQHVENAASPPSSGVAPSSSPGSPTEEAQDVRRAANSTADVTENTTMKSSAASSAQDNSQSSVSCSPGYTGGGGGIRRSLLPQPSLLSSPSTTANPAQAKRTPSSTSLSGLKIQLASSERKTSLASPIRLQSPSQKEEAKKPSSTLHRSLTLPASTRNAVKKVPTIRSLERASRTESDTKPALSFAGRTAAAKQPETPGVSRGTSIKRYDSSSRQSPVRSVSKLPSSQSSSTTTATGASSLRQPTNPRLVLSSRKPAQSSISKPRPAVGSGLRKPSTTHIKAPATSLATKSTTGSDPASSASGSYHFSALQTEILQLQLFHSRAVEWNRLQEEKIKGKIHEQYETVAEKHDSVNEREAAEQRYINVTAINALGKEMAGLSEDEDTVAVQLGLLSQSIEIVSQLTDPSSGKYSTCIRDFKEWITKVERIRRSHSRSHISGLRLPAELAFTEKKRLHESQFNPKESFDPPFTEPLSQEWEMNVVSLRGELAQVAGDLESIGITLESNLQRILKGDGVASSMRTQPSALLQIINGHRNLVVSMIEELDEIRDVEADVMAAEKNWLRQEADRLISQRDDICEGQSHAPRMGIWQKDVNPV